MGILYIFWWEYILLESFRKQFAHKLKSGQITQMTTDRGMAYFIHQYST